MILMSSNIADVVAAWSKKSELLSRALERGLKNGLEQFMKQRLLHEQLRGRKGNNYGLNVGTGNALNSLSVRMYREGIDAVGIIGVAERAWYLKLHQHYKFDGYARVHNGGTFCVPIHPAAHRHRPSDFGEDLVMIKRPGKNPLLIRRAEKGKSGQIQRKDIMFVLTKQIYIPKRLYFTEEFEVQGRQLIRINILESIKEVARAA
jgi:hypothetical protein